MSDISETVAAGQLRAFVERVERIEAEIKDLNDDKSEIYKEMRGVGFDVKAVRKVVAQRKLDSSERQERDAIFNLYWDALHGSQEGRAGAHVENIEKFDPETGEVNQRHSPAPANETRGGDGDDCSVGKRGEWPPQGGESSTRALNDIGAEQVVTGGESAATSLVSHSADEGVPRPGVECVAEPRQTPISNPVAVLLPATDKAGEEPPPASPAPIPDEDVPSFLRDRKPLRPHCQHPDDLEKCGGSGREHCYSCRKAMQVAA